MRKGVEFHGGYLGCTSLHSTSRLPIGRPRPTWMLLLPSQTQKRVGYGTCLPAPYHPLPLCSLTFFVFFIFQLQQVPGRTGFNEFIIGYNIQYGRIVGMVNDRYTLGVLD